MAKHKHDLPDMNSETAECLLCSQPQIEILQDAYCMLRGAFMENVDLGITVFKIDPDTDLKVFTLADGSLAIYAPQTRMGPTRYVEAECMHRVAYDVGAPAIDPEDEQQMFDDTPLELR